MVLQICLHAWHSPLLFSCRPHDPVQILVPRRRTCIAQRVFLRVTAFSVSLCRCLSGVLSMFFPFLSIWLVSRTADTYKFCVVDGCAIPFCYVCILLSVLLVASDRRNLAVYLTRQCTRVALGDCGFAHGRAKEICMGEGKLLSS